MNPARKSILAYLAVGQASFPALAESTKLSRESLRKELDRLVAKQKVVTSTITATLKDRPRFKVTVYRLA